MGLPVPIVLTRLDGARCLVVGGGAVAERKVDALLAGGATILVVSPAVTARLAAWSDQGRITHLPRAFCDEDMAGVFMAIAATDDRLVNARVARLAGERNILVNVADDPDAGNFHTAAVFRQGDLLIGVTTGGAGPAVAALVRRKLETLFGREYAELLDLLRALRPLVQREVPPGARRRLWRALASDQLLDWLRDGRPECARQYAERLIDAARPAAGALDDRTSEPAIR